MNLQFFIVILEDLRDGQLGIAEEHDDNDVFVSCCNSQAHMVVLRVVKHGLLLLALHQDVPQLLKVVHDYILVDFGVLELRTGEDLLEVSRALVVFLQGGDLVRVVGVPLQK